MRSPQTEQYAQGTCGQCGQRGALEDLYEIQRDGDEQHADQGRSGAGHGDEEVAQVSGA